MPWQPSWLEPLNPKPRGYVRCCYGTVDGGNLAPLRGPKLLYFLGLWGVKVMQDFLHQQDLGALDLP